MGRPGKDALVRESDEVIERVVLEDLEKICGRALQSERVVISRLLDGLPAYTVGHAERIQAVRDAVSSHYPHIHLAGLAYDGVGLPDCVAGVKTTLEQMALQQSEPCRES
ncbi:hypothetical protein OVA29_16770 [Exiguobacterium sp. SL14]|nr:hypothetical protein [Exiguobacterium sp. SL14]